MLCTNVIASQIQESCVDFLLTVQKFVFFPRLGGQTISSIKGVYDQLLAPKARLLTPEEGCGYSKVQNTRIVGGTPAKAGAWPW